MIYNFLFHLNTYPLSNATDVSILYRLITSFLAITSDHLFILIKNLSYQYTAVYFIRIVSIVRPTPKFAKLF